MNIVTRYDPYTSTVFDYDDRSQKSIFISIISYRDKNIIDTVQSLVKNAKRSQNLMVSIAVAVFEAEDRWISDLEDLCKRNPENINLRVLDCNSTTTIGLLKKIADSSYNKEDYYLSISSRSEFDPHWDDILIKQFDITKNFFSDKDIVITVDPRKYLPHDEITKNFVFYTNHKTKKSLQREEYDGARIPVSGYNTFVNSDNILSDASNAGNNYDPYDSLHNKEIAKKNEIFLEKYGIVKFVNRKFVKDEYISLAIGISSDFIFSNGKTFIKNNPSNEFLVDKEQYDFYLFLNLLKNNTMLLSLRFIPVYKLHYDEIFTLPMPTPSDRMTEEEYKKTKGIQIIDNLVEKMLNKNEDIYNLLSIDWEKKKIKVREGIPGNTIINDINCFISLYNFSTYENSLHWNNRC